jgi:molybdopterin molybdotransferase
VPLAAVAGRRLAADVVALHDVPAAPSSAMDGWAVRAGDGRTALRVAGECPAGHAPGGALGTGEAFRISTGAPLPPGADAVVRREDGREIGDRLVVEAVVSAGDHVRPRGDDVAAGERLLAAGTVVAAHEASVIAAAGHGGARCLARPRVAFATTGDELVAPGRPVPPAGRIESNLAGLAAQATAAGAVVGRHAHLRDERGATRAGLAGLLEDEPDLLVTVGGISVGRHDHVGGALERLDARWAFRGVAMRPGHPAGIAVRGATVIVALPGNPAAAAVAFHVFGRAVLGVREDWTRRARLAVPHRPHPHATAFVRCAETPGGLTPLERQGPAQLASLAGARLLAWVEPGVGLLDAGEPLLVSPMP